MRRSLPIRRAGLALACCVALAAACTTEGSGPRPLSVSPPRAAASQATTITITGEGFAPAIRASYDDPSGSEVSTRFMVRLAGPTPIDLTNVAYVSPTQLSAVVPAGQSVGRYGLTVIDPREQAGTLPDAFEVVGAVDGGADTGAVDGGADTDVVDGGADTDVIDSGADGPTPDTLAPDTLAPDTLAPDTGKPTYVDEDFSSGSGAMISVLGTWQVSGGKLSQADETINGAYARATVSANDYVAETRVTIQQIDNITATEGAALGVRVQALLSAGVTPPSYFCMISPDVDTFIIGRCDGTSTFCTALKSSSVNIKLNTAYRIRATVSGSSLTCRLLGQNVTLTQGGLSWSGGDVSLMTLHARAAFEYLTVVGL
jgi:hypothetical protein